MKTFDRIFKFLHRGLHATPAQNCFFNDLQLIKREGALKFVVPQKFNADGFFGWFRWGILAMALIMAWIVACEARTAGHVVVSVVLWFMALVAAGIGVVGAFVVAPIMRRIFRSADAFEEMLTHKLPVFDLQQALVRLPEGQGTHAFSDAIAIEVRRQDDQWSSVQLRMKAGEEFFLFNFRTSSADLVGSMLRDVSTATRITLAGG